MIIWIAEMCYQLPFKRIIPAAVDQRSQSDRHLLVVDCTHRHLYELYNVWYDTARARWHAGSGAVFDLDANDRRPDGFTSADAAGLAILPGLVRHDDVFGPDPVRHALRVTVRYTQGHVFPASHTASNSTNPSALPMGARLRLKAAKDMSGHPTPVRKIFEAMKTHGLIVADNGSNLYVSGAYDPRWDNDVLNPAFASLKASDFEVVERGWKPPVATSTGPTDFYTLAPCRLLDTRLPPGPAGGPALPPASDRVLVLAGRCGVPATARALALNVTVVAGPAPGHLQLFPGDGTPPGTSALNFAAGQTRANNAVLKTASSANLSNCKASARDAMIFGPIKQAAVWLEGRVAVAGTFRTDETHPQSFGHIIRRVNKREPGEPWKKKTGVPCESPYSA